MSTPRKWMYEHDIELFHDAARMQRRECDQVPLFDPAPANASVCQLGQRNGQTRPKPFSLHYVHEPLHVRITVVHDDVEIEGHAGARRGGQRRTRRRPRSSPVRRRGRETAGHTGVRPSAGLWISVNPKRLREVARKALASKSGPWIASIAGMDKGSNRSSTRSTSAPRNSLLAAADRDGSAPADRARPGRARPEHPAQRAVLPGRAALLLRRAGARRVRGARRRRAG